MEKLKILKFNKEIFSLKLSITNACNLRCKYCFVAEGDEFMDLKTASAAINFFLSSPGENKILILYGGEPLLNPNWRNIILLARRARIVFKKNLIIALATNGLFLDKENLSFLKKQTVATSISIDGGELSHDFNRRFPDGRGSFKHLLGKIKLVFKIFRPENVSALMTIDPRLSKYLYKNFLSVVKLGFSLIHIAPVHGVVWGPRQKNFFFLNFGKITKFCFNNIKKDKFIFLSPLFHPFTSEWFETSPQNGACPFYGDLEIYPSGDISFSNFLINSPDKNIRQESLIGNITRDFFSDFYQHCRFDFSSSQCQRCFPNYYKTMKDAKFQGSEITSERNKLLKLMSDKIRSISPKDRRYENYCKKLEKTVKRLIK